MKYLVLGLLGFFGLLLESTLFNELMIAGVKPDLVLIIVILYAIFSGPREGAIVGLFLGFIEDLFMAKYLGINALSKFFVGLIIGSLEKRIYKENFIVPTIALLVGSLIHGLLFIFISNIVGYPLGIKNGFNVVIPVAIYNTCFAPFVYGSFYKATTKRELDL
jgi:rod shape-determining protein MreD